MVAITVQTGADCEQDHSGERTSFTDASAWGPLCSPLSPVPFKNALVSDHSFSCLLCVHPKCVEGNTDGVLVSTDLCPGTAVRLSQQCSARHQAPLTTPRILISGSGYGPGIRIFK